MNVYNIFQIHNQNFNFINEQGFTPLTWLIIKSEIIEIEDLLIVLNDGRFNLFLLNNFDEDVLDIAIKFNVNKTFIKILI